MSNLLPWVDVFCLNGNNLKHFLCVFPSPSCGITSPHTAFHLSVMFLLPAIKDLRADINYVAREVVLLCIIELLMPPLPLKIIHLTTAFTTAVHTGWWLWSSHFSGSGIIRLIPENDCLSQPESELHQISSSGCPALSDISCTFFLFRENKYFLLLKGFWLQYTE